MNPASLIAAEAMKLLIVIRSVLAAFTTSAASSSE